MLKYFGWALKAALSVGFLVLIVRKNNPSPQVLTLLLRPATLAGIIFSATAILVQGGLAALRQIEILDLFRHRISYLHSLRVWFSGLFVTQVGVTFIAGDVVRGLQLAAGGVPNRVAGRAIALERIVGLAVLLVMVIVVSPFVTSLANNYTLRMSLQLLAVAGAATLAGLLLAGLAPRLVARLPWAFGWRRPLDIISDLVGSSRFLYAAPRHFFRIAELSFVMHLLNAGGIVVIARALGVQASMWEIGCFAVPIMLLTMLPVSFAGWGVREAAMVTGFATLGIPAYLALATSIGFGLSSIIASLPGVFGIWRGRLLPMAMSGSSNQSGHRP